MTSPFATELLIGVTGVLTSAISSTLGMAGGMILLGVLTALMPVKEAVPVHGFAQLCSNLGRVVAYFRDIEWRISARFAALAIPGAYLGGRAVRVLNADWMELFIGLFILWNLFGQRLMRKPKREVKPWAFVLLGFVSSFLGMIGGGTGPMVFPYFMDYGARHGWGKRRMVATKAFSQAVIHFVKLPAFAWVVGVDLGAQGRLFAILAMASVLGTWLGSKLIDRISDHAYEKLVRVSVALVAARMVAASALRLV